jgi:hypothetical protein
VAARIPKHPRAPHESIRIGEIAKVADHGDPDGFLRLDELALEEVDEAIALVRVERVLPELHDGAARVGWCESLTSGVQIH